MASIILLSLLVWPTDVVYASRYPPINLLPNNRTALNKEFAPHWVPEPNFRGTWRLLYSCLFTLTLCVYTSIHSNVPLKGERLWPLYLRKTKWVVIAIFTPEFVLFTACAQFFTARKLCQELNQLLDKNVEQIDTEDHHGRKLSESSAQQRYDITYGYYVVMGGFVVDEDKYSNGPSQLTITALGVLELSLRGHHLNVSEDSINDKSKANLLAKGLVFLQVSWMVVQCIARKVSGYPLSMLEVHTLVHVVCASAMYALWFYKPLDINDPTLVDMSSHTESLAVLLAYTDYMYLRQTGKPRHQLTRLQDALHFFNHRKVRGEDTDAGIDLRSQQKFHCNNPTKKQLLQLTLPPDTKRMHKLGYEQFIDNGMGLGWYDVELEVSRKDITRWNLIAATAHNVLREEMNGTTQHPRGDNSYDQIRDIFKCYSIDDFLVGRAYNFSYQLLSYQLFVGNKLDLKFTFGDEIGSRPAKVLAMVAFFSAVYGGIHLIAWNFDFPTRAEDIMWKLSCFESIFGVMLPALGYLIHKMTDGVLNRFTWALVLFDALSLFLGGLFLPFWACSRVFIVVELFLSLRHAPIGVYATIPWTEFFPRF